MNVFEDLVVELKEENLLEDTVIGNDAGSGPKTEPRPTAYETLPTPASSDHVKAVRLEDDAPDAADLQLMGSSETVEIRRPSTEVEFFKKRANGEVSSLQMVDHVLSGIEREQLKSIPRSYDDLEVKKALHAFMQVADNISDDRHKEAEFKLMQEVEGWCSALSLRDKSISVSALRRYCETCRPMLSSQAMLSLARFYRNLPYSEDVRGKFDYIITRLFSRPLDDETRKLLFTSDQMLGHIKTLYADWSSIPLYSADDESRIKLAAASFRELTDEAESTRRFDDLIRSDFFGRLRLFKESIAEMFFAPAVTVAAIECNIRIGNVFVELIDKERRRAGNSALQDKFAAIDDHAVSEAAGRSLHLDQLLKGLANRPDLPVEEDPEEFDDPAPVEKAKEAAPAAPAVSEKAVLKGPVAPAMAHIARNGVFGINRWLLLGGAVIIALSAAVWMWGEFVIGDDQATTAGIVRADISSAPFQEHVRVAKVSADTVYAVLQPTWETMPKEKREDLLKSVYQYGPQGGWKNVSLLNSQGRAVGFASASRFELLEPTP